MSRNGSGDSPRDRRNIRDATRNLERAVEELASAATRGVSGRAARLLDEAAARIRGEARRADRRETAGKTERAQGRRERRSERNHDYEDYLHRSRGLYLDRENRKIVGVCAGVARYLGIEAWVARCAALTGLLFLPSIVFPAYWIAFFVMGHRPPVRSGAQRGAWKGGSRGKMHAGKRRRRAEEREEEREEGRKSAARHGRRSRDRKNDHRSPAPEWGARYSPRRSLRVAQADLAEVELRLRRMEAFVTSDRYTLERGFAEIGANSAAGSPPGSDTPRSASNQQEKQ